MTTEHPLWDSPHRLFFLMMASWAMLAMGLWLLDLAGISWLNNMRGGAMLWHAHELLFGFASLAITGFILTAVPEFTHTEIVPAQQLKRLAWLWLAGRGLFLIGTQIPVLLAVAASADTLFLIWLLRLIWQPLWNNNERRHMSLAYTLIVFALVNLVFYCGLLKGFAYQSLMLLSGTLMVLIILALARISMSVVNDQLNDIAPEQDPYIARPPRRNLAILCIILFSLMAFVQPYGQISGYLALACGAAVLNLLNDWHIGKVLLRRWVVIPYGILWIMATGFIVQGLGILTQQAWQSVGQHLLLALAMSLSILYVLLVAGGNHSGFGLDWRHRLMWVLALFVALVGLRSVALWFPAHYTTLLWIGGLGWIACWAILLPMVWRTLWHKSMP